MSSRISRTVHSGIKFYPAIYPQLFTRKRERKEIWPRTLECLNCVRRRKAALSGGCMKQLLQVLLLITVILASAGAQTQMHLRTQSNSIDHSAALSTKPFKSGTSLPAICSIGDFFFNTQPGLNLFACTATNVWTLQSGDTGASSLSGLSDVLLLTPNQRADTALRFCGG
jgi:hypothetical protein